VPVPVSVDAIVGISALVDSASGLTNQPPGSVGTVSRPATTKLLYWPALAKAAQR
jgi:hypothetical protein